MPATAPTRNADPGKQSPTPNVMANEAAGGFNLGTFAGGLLQTAGQIVEHYTNPAVQQTTAQAATAAAAAPAATVTTGNGAAARNTGEILAIGGALALIYWLWRR